MGTSCSKHFDAVALSRSCTDAAIAHGIHWVTSYAEEVDGGDKLLNWLSPFPSRTLAKDSHTWTSLHNEAVDLIKTNSYYEDGTRTLRSPPPSECQ